MSITPFVLLFCNECADEGHYDAMNEGMGHRTACKARAWNAGQGGAQVGKRDLCHFCNAARLQRLADGLPP